MNVLRLIVIALGVAVLALAVACEEDSNESADGTPAEDTPAEGTPGEGTPGDVGVCDQADAVQAAVEGLVGFEVLAEGTDALKAGVADVQAEVDELQQTAQAEVEDEVQALSDAVDEAEALLSTIEDEETLNAQIDDVQAALTGVATAASDLQDALPEECG